MNIYYQSSQLLLDNLYPAYKTVSSTLIRYIEKDKSLSRFQQFNTRFKISWGMQIGFADDLNVKNEDARACYRMMLKISDLWFAFEHLLGLAEGVVSKKAKGRSKVRPFADETFTELGFDEVTRHFNDLCDQTLFVDSTSRREFYLFGQYIKNNLENKTVISYVEETRDLVHERRPLEVWQLLAFAYGIRNLYVHEGIAAAFGRKDYKFKRQFYEALYDVLVLYTLALGHAYCTKKLSEYAI